MSRPHASPRKLATLILFALMGSALSCALYEEDRCWVPPEQYEAARNIFLATGSLDLLQRRLEDSQWRRCKINEVVYRIGKEFEVLPEAYDDRPDLPAL